MTVSKAKIGHDWTAPALTTITPEPKSTGVQTTRRSIAADSAIYEESPYIILEWDFLDDSNAYGSLLNQFGLVSGLTSPVTILVRNQFFALTLYNGTAIRPETGNDVEWSNYFPRNIKILIRDLVAL